MESLENATIQLSGFCYCVIFVCIPSWFIISIRLISPHIPSFTFAASKEFNSVWKAASFNNRYYLIRFSAVFAFLRTN